MNPNDTLQLDPTSRINSPYAMDDEGRYLNREMEALYKMIENQFKASVQLGHDSKASHEWKQRDARRALDLINSPLFDQLCYDIGLDIDHVRPRIQRLAEMRLGKKDKFCAYQISIEMECV